MISGLILGVKKASSEPTISTITLPKTKGPETLNGSTVPNNPVVGITTAQAIALLPYLQPGFGLFDLTKGLNETLGADTAARITNLLTSNTGSTS